MILGTIYGICSSCMSTASGSSNMELNIEAIEAASSTEIVGSQKLFRWASEIRKAFWGTPEIQDWMLLILEVFMRLEGF